MNGNKENTVDGQVSDIIKVVKGKPTIELIDLSYMFSLHVCL